jgi:hypothetical protein
MAETPKVHKVDPDQIKTGTAIEKAEHPWASTATAKKIAMDHISQNSSAYTGKKGGGANAGSGGGTVVIINERVHISSTPKKPKPKPEPQNQPFQWWNYGRELL